MSTDREDLSEHTLLRIQAISGLAFASFLILHLTNTLTAVLGQASYDRVQGGLRTYYQWPPVELVVVLLAPAVHLWAAAVRILRRRRRDGSERTPSWRVRLHRYTGYVLALFVFGHIAATRGPGVFSDMPADFSFLTFSLTYWPWIFYPYYALFFASGFYHLAHGAALSVRLFGLRFPSSLMAPRSRGFWTLVAVASLGGLVAILALAGLLHPVSTERFVEFEVFYERYFPAFALPWR